VAVSNLILFRHAKAEDPMEAPTDEERALTPAGRAAALAQATRLLELGCTPDCVLASSATRTRQTWEEAAKVFGGVPAEFTDRLYLASPRTVLDVARAASAGTVIVVGHNPGLHMLACDLIDATDRSQMAELVRERFKTAELAWFVSDDESRTGFALLHFLARDR
jgi:phosphohistidine phosphatase